MRCAFRQEMRCAYKFLNKRWSEKIGRLFRNRSRESILGNPANCRLLAPRLAGNAGPQQKRRRSYEIGRASNKYRIAILDNLALNKLSKENSQMSIS